MIKRIFIALGIFIVVILLDILLLRIINPYRYPPLPGNDPIYEAPTDMNRYQAPEGIEQKHVQGDYLNGFHLIPEKIRHEGIVICFGGSEGSPNYQRAIQLAQNGYETYALFYFGMENQKPILNEIPLDFFNEVLAEVNKNARSATPITLIGASKGAELALELAVHYPDKIDHIVLYAPSAYAFSGFDFKNFTSSWTYQGNPVPYIDLRKAGFLQGMRLLWEQITQSPLHLRPYYEAAVRNSDNAEQARIPIEKSNAEILLFAGAMDKMWQSNTMAESIKEHAPKRTELNIFPNAGHSFFGNSYLTGMLVGGTKIENEAAHFKSEYILFKKLLEWHSRK